MASQESTRVIGIRHPEEIATAFKTEAAARNIRLNELFQEMWELYRKSAVPEDWTSNGS